MNGVEQKASNIDDRASAEALVRFVLDHPGMSQWLKDALHSAMKRDPVAVLNDIEILYVITRLRLKTTL